MISYSQRAFLFLPKKKNSTKVDIFFSVLRLRYIYKIADFSILCYVFFDKIQPQPTNTYLYRKLYPSINILLIKIHYFDSGPVTLFLYNKFI